MNARILIVDDEPAIRQTLADFLSDEGYQCRQAASGADALEQIRMGGTDVVLTDVRMPGMDGIELMKQVNQWSPETLVVLMTAFASVDSAIAALRSGAADYFIKPIDLDDLALRLAGVIERQSLIRENRYLREVIDRSFNYNFIIGESQPMKHIYRMIEKVAASRSTVLITGPSGSGKELVARALHQQSERKRKPFIAINCGSIPESLFESELFGHKKGAFTGAVADRDGAFILANGGTLFLDEIGELPLPMQVKLLRVLQEGDVQPVGAASSSKVDVRILAATNRILAKEVEEGRFREDLYYRINIIEISMPTLNRRMEDIPLLARHFLDRFTRELRKDVKGIRPDAMAQLLAHEWKGQVRELENVIERAVLLTEDDLIGVEDLPFRREGILPEPGGLADAAGAAGSDGSRGGEGEETTLGDAVSTFERQYIQHMLRKYNGNRTETARALSIDTSTLYRKMERYQLFDGVQPDA